MPEEIAHKEFRDELRGLVTSLNALRDEMRDNTAETKGIRKAVEIQNGRVTKLEGRWEKLVIAVIVALFGATVGLVVFIYTEDQRPDMHVSAIQEALQGLELKVTQ